MELIPTVRSVIKVFLQNLNKNTVACIYKVYKTKYRNTQRYTMQSWRMEAPLVF